MPSAPSTPSAAARSRGRRCSSRSLGGDDATAGRAALLGRLPVASAGARRPARGDGRTGPGSRRDRGARGRHRPARREHAVRRVPHDPHRRRGHRPAARRRAVRPHVPRLPAPRRPLLPRAGPRGPARGPPERDDQEHPMTTIAIGAAAPSFDLPDTDGARHTLGGGGDTPAPATALVFTCNHCPYALAWHDRLLAVARDYADRGVVTLLICSNDAERYSQDGPDAMRER